MLKLNTHTKPFSVRKWVAALCVFNSCFAALWLAIDSSWFSLPHFTALPALETAQAIADGTRVSAYPLLHLFEGFCLFMSGFSVWGFAVPGILSFIILLCSVAALSRELDFDYKTTCVWLFVLSFSPVVFGAMRWYDFHLPLIAFVALSVFLLVRLRRDFSFGNFVAWAAVMLIGGLLCGGSTPTETLVFWLNCSGGILWFFISVLKERGVSRVVVFLLLCFLLFVLNLTVVFALSGWSFDSAQAYYAGEIGNYWNIAGNIVVWGRAVFVNIAGLSSSQLGTPFFILLCIGLPVWVKKETSQGRLLMLCWFFVPLIVFGILPKKSLVFTNPVVVPACVFCVYGLKAFNPGRRALWLLAALCVFVVGVLSFFNVPCVRKAFFLPGPVMSSLNNVSPDYLRPARGLPEWGRGFLEDCTDTIVSRGRDETSIFLCRSDRQLHTLSALGMELFFSLRKDTSKQNIDFSHIGIPVGGDIDFVVSAMSKLCRSDYILLDFLSRAFLFDNPFGSKCLAPDFKLAVSGKTNSGHGVFLYVRKKAVSESMRRALAFADRMGGGARYLNADKLEPEDMDYCVLVLEFMSVHGSNGFLKAQYLVALVRLYHKLDREQEAADTLGRLIEMVDANSSPVFCAEYMMQAAELCRDIGLMDRAVELFERARILAGTVSDESVRSQMLDGIAVQKRELDNNGKK